MQDDWTSSVDLFLDFDRTGGIREGLENAIRAAIRDGRLRAGVVMPSSRALAHDLGVARGTVTAVYSQLAAEGYLTARQGAVSRVVWVPPAPPAPEPPPAAARPRWDLRPGQPDSSSFPVREWSRAARRVLQRIPEEAFGYGDSRGRPELRHALADYLGRARGVRADPGRLMVCGGFTQALTMICQALRAGGATSVAMEDPNAPRYRDMAQRSGLTVLPVPCDDHGLRTDELSRLPVSAVVVTPAHQYPLGATMSAKRRNALVEWARRHGTLIVEDDYDGEFRFGRRPVGALQQMDPEHVVYAGSASKTLAPGLRMGWITLPSAIRDALIATKERLDRGNSVIDQLVLAELIRSGEFDRHVRRMRSTYRGRHTQLADAVAGRLPGLRYRGTAAGLHAVLPLSAAVPHTDRQLLATAADHGVAVHTLARYWHAPAEDRPRAIIVGYGTPPGHAFRPALDALIGFLLAVHGP
jgi:GntR family transcriptional regulator/MocR family aminotransferase